LAKDQFKTSKDALELLEKKTPSFMVIRELGMFVSKLNERQEKHQKTFLCKVKM
jgi:hypothetical protein